VVGKISVKQSRDKAISMEWIRIFSTEEEARNRLLPDRPQRVVIGETRICLVKHNDKFFAVQDACSHNGESLSRGKINYLGEVVCPWHGYRFELKSGKPCDSSSPDLKTYPLKIDDSGFFIGL
jgi:3-phenylpropionate/trans-cinnamate dioxygenase ferredoxin subunit